MDTFQDKMKELLKESIEAEDGSHSSPTQAVTLISGKEFAGFVSEIKEEYFVLRGHTTRDGKAREDTIRFDQIAAISRMNRVE